MSNYIIMIVISTRPHLQFNSNKKGNIDTILVFLRQKSTDEFKMNFVNEYFAGSLGSMYQT